MIFFGKIKNLTPFSRGEDKCTHVTTLVANVLTQ